ncbi:hypothetical protein [Streptomyces sp. NPDC046985]|uniref:hypothetical protein n=1 Tax=Streptomyces sp. NPDC046985 TaxID=3155377 RepID=UPI0033FCA757
MLLTAVLLLPLLSGMLMVMDRIEDRVLDPDSARARHAGRRRHLRLIPGGRQDTPPSAEGMPDDDAPAQESAA